MYRAKPAARRILSTHHAHQPVITAPTTHIHTFGKQSEMKPV